MYTDKKIMILGCARSGIAAAKILSKDNEVYLTDIKELNEETDRLLKELNVKVLIGEDQASFLDESFDFVVKNPGILPSNSLVQKAKELDILVINEMEVAYNFIPEKTFVIGVTGSNGKTTTVTLIYELLKKKGLDVVLGGNIGIPLCDLIPSIKEDTILLLEISDHQLLNLKKLKTNISLLTNICPTHLDYHGTFEKYKETKKLIFSNHRPEDIAFINESNQNSLDITEDIASFKYYFCSDENYITDEGIYIHKDLIISLSDISLIGKHNYENILAALMVVDYFGIDKDLVKEFLSTFNGVEHRIEFVKKIDGVSYYNDSKATNPTSVITALNTFSNKVHLILGGAEASQNFEALKDNLENVSHVYAIGETTNRVVDFATKYNIPSTECVTLKNAINKAYENASESNVVLLSPASASFDQYKKFEDRGEEFKNIVNSL
ncbi:MAG: UDP-N-acetylmuramoyl-L-alanine--D-glutamate ligase [bacterium]